MIAYVIDAVRPVAGGDIYVVVGYRAGDVMAACSGQNVHFVTQSEQLGTGHAVMQCEGALAGFSGTVVVLNGDVPCLRAETIRRFIEYHGECGAVATVLTAVLDDPAGYGRIVKDGDDSLMEIIEEKDADDATKRIREVNSGLFCFDKVALFRSLKSIGRRNAQGEYYLTDVVRAIGKRGGRVRAYLLDDANEVAGVNTDRDLESVRKRVRGRAR
jgi:bifunctional N-acetylglucosamine-1-phosphate-uridyltransferase/glucosamine-1-phosphate-acetyltransferase GlmU-like protein